MAGVVADEGVRSFPKSRNVDSPAAPASDAVDARQAAYDIGPPGPKRDDRESIGHRR
ncbi:hypothetical protein [Streptomyces zaomyceticus]|uniref:hypothetical protein n=1 Tax=Streptomyces zaomyceticus TaxID=68286 RepID=UPI0034416956